MSTAPLVTRNSARWKPSGSFSRTVFSITRGPAKPISAFGSAITTSPRKANEADTPPMVGSVSTLMKGSFFSAMLTKLSEKKLPFISVLTDPTMGGVSASFAFLGDVVIAEPKALIGFAGPRVIENTVREKLPEGFQRAEFLVTKGAVDMIVDRRKMREEIARLLALLQNQAVEVLA